MSAVSINLDKRMDLILLSGAMAFSFGISIANSIYFKRAKDNTSTVISEKSAEAMETFSIIFSVLTGLLLAVGVYKLITHPDTQGSYGYAYLAKKFDAHLKGNPRRDYQVILMDSAGAAHTGMSLLFITVLLGYLIAAVVYFARMSHLTAGTVTKGQAKTMRTMNVLVLIVVSIVWLILIVNFFVQNQTVLKKMKEAKEAMGRGAIYVKEKMSLGERLRRSEPTTQPAPQDAQPAPQEPSLVQQATQTQPQQSAFD